MKKLWYTPLSSGLSTEKYASPNATDDVLPAVAKAEASFVLSLGSLISAVQKVQLNYLF
jgi:hypothetical protein